MSTATTQMSKTQIRQHVAEIEEQGFSIIEKAIAAEQMAAIRADLAPYCQGRNLGRNNFEGERTERVYALLAKSTRVADIIEHADVLSIIDRLLPKNYLLSAALSILIHPGETEQPFHFDDNGGALPIAKHRPRFGISTIWAFDDFTADNGATEIVPGSHRWQADRQPKPDEIVKAVMPAGAVLIFDGALIHRGGANRSTADRMAITPQYCIPGLRQLENMSLAVPPDTASQFSARIQSLLGYSIVEPGFMGYVDGMHPKRLINPSYLGRKYRPELPPS